MFLQSKYCISLLSPCFTAVVFVLYSVCADMPIFSHNVYFYIYVAKHLHSALTRLKDTAVNFCSLFKNILFLYYLRLFFHMLGMKNCCKVKDLNQLIPVMCYINKLNKMRMNSVLPIFPKNYTIEKVNIYKFHRLTS